MQTRILSLIGGLAAWAFLVACASEEGTWNPSPLAVENIASPAGPGSSEPNLTTTGDGDVILSWVEPAGESTHALRFARWSNGAWSEAKTIARRSDIWLNWADFPVMSSIGRGVLAAHWPQRSGSGRYDYDVRIALSRDGGETWTDGILPHPTSRVGEHGFVSLGSVDDSLLALWLDGRGYDTTRADATGAMALVARTLSPDGALGEEVVVDARTCDCCQTDLAVTSRGPVVVYRDRSENEIRDIMLIRRDSAGWTAPRAVHADGWRVDYCPVNGPAVAARDTLVVTAWFTAPNDSPVVRVAFSYDAGDTFSVPVRVDDGDPVGRVDVALLADGSAAVLWLERMGNEGAEVRVRRVSRDGQRGEAAVVGGTSAARASGFPRMAMSNDAILFAWTQPGDSSRVHTARVKLDLP